MCSSEAVSAITNAVQDLGQKAYMLTPDANDEIGLGLGAYFDPHIATKDAYNRYQDSQKKNDKSKADDIVANQEKEPDMYLGGLAAGRRYGKQGKGIGANILTSGAGVQSKAKTKRNTLLG
jgi:hypothetical protein